MSGNTLGRCQVRLPGGCQRGLAEQPSMTVIPVLISIAVVRGHRRIVSTIKLRGATMDDPIVEARVARALLSGPATIRDGATVADMDDRGNMTVLRPGTNEWVCMPGVEIGQADMCADPMGMQWFTDLMMRKPKPTNTAPGLVYMLNGATQHSYTDPFDRTSPPIPIGPHWMLIWPFDAEASGLSTVMRDAGTMIMFAGTPYAHLHICGDPWAGNEYHPGDKAVWTMTYDQRAEPGSTAPK